jgi:hypothetical protein
LDRQRSRDEAYRPLLGTRSGEPNNRLFSFRALATFSLKTFNKSVPNVAVFASSTVTRAYFPDEALKRFRLTTARFWRFGTAADLAMVNLRMNHNTT